MQTDFAYDEGAPLAPAPGVIMHEAPRYRTPPPARARRPPWSLRGLKACAPWACCVRSASPLVGLPQRYQHLVNDISSSDGKLMLVDVVIPPGRDPHSGKFIDLNMLVMTGGLERAERSFASFLEASGFRLVRVVKTRLPNQHS
jgi:hypothetical protein